MSHRNCKAMDAVLAAHQEARPAWGLVHDILLRLIMHDRISQRTLPHDFKTLSKALVNARAADQKIGALIKSKARA